MPIKILKEEFTLVVEDRGDYCYFKNIKFLDFILIFFYNITSKIIFVTDT